MVEGYVAIHRVALAVLFRAQGHFTLHCIDTDLGCDALVWCVWVLLEVLFGLDFEEIIRAVKTVDKMAGRRLHRLPNPRLSHIVLLWCRCS